MDWIRAEGRRIWNTVVWSWQGWCAAWATQASLRRWSQAQALSVLSACLLDLTAAERGLVIALGFLVLAAELMNTAVETVVDLVSPDRHPLAGRAKDCASAAVALTAVATGVAWVLVLLG